MSEWLQYSLVTAIIAAAGLYLIVYALRWLWRKKTSGCGSGCGKCPSAAPKTPLVQLEIRNPGKGNLRI
jgi:hypothetical protein